MYAVKPGKPVFDTSQHFSQTEFTFDCPILSYWKNFKLEIVSGNKIVFLDIFTPMVYLYYYFPLFFCRAYSRPILRLAVERDSLLQKLWRALF